MSRFNLPDPSGVEWLTFADPPSLPADTKTRETHQFNHKRQMRPQFCAGGEYVVRFRTERDAQYGPPGSPIIAKTRDCAEPAVYPTALCESCTRRERDMREQLAAYQAKRESGVVVTAGRNRWAK